MDEHSIWLLVAIIICIILSAFFSATETAFSTLSRARIKNMIQDGNKKAKIALRLSENYDVLISSILIGNNIVNITCATFATVFFSGLIGDKNGPTVSTIVITVIVLIFGEVTPKSIAKEIPEQYASAVAPVFSFLNIVFKPINFVLLKIKGTIRKMLGVEKSGGITENELLSMVDEAEQEGGLNEDESELIKNAIEFNDVEACDILTPRIDVEGVEVNSTNEEIFELFRETGFSRLPVYRDTIDSILGVINEKDFHNNIMGSNHSIKTIMKPAEFIPPSMKISELLKNLQRRKLHIAVVVDEFGGTEGIVTMEDMLEELVGEIWDEHDEIFAAITDLGDGKFVVPTENDLDDLFEMFQITQQTDSSTINGWIIENLDKIPSVGDSFDLDNLTVVVTKSESQRATEINVIVNHEKIIEEED